MSGQTSMVFEDLVAVERSVIAAAPMAMLLLDADGYIVLANARAERCFSCSSLEGSTFEALVDAESRLRWRGMAAGRRDVAPPAGEDTACSVELRGLRPGRTFLMEVSLAPLGATSAMTLVVVRDVTSDRAREQQQEAAIRASRDTCLRLDLLLTFAPAFIIAVSRQGTIEFINQTLPQYTREGTIGSSWLQYFAPSRHAFMAEVLEEVYTSGATRSYEVSTPAPDGSVVWFESRIAPMRMAGQIVGAVLVSQDITERKRVEGEVIAGRPMALLGTLASGIAHEINTPVQFVGDSIHFLRDAVSTLFALFDQIQELRRAAIAGSPMAAIALAAEKAEDEADLPFLRVNVPQAFDSCISGLARVATIVRSLKDFVHPSEGDMLPADLNRAIQSTVAIAINEYKYFADVRTELGELPLVTCRLSDIAQAILNIIVNAAHAIEGVVGGTEERGEITIRSWREGEWAVISIRDTGTGIAESIQARVFDPFFTTKEVGKGTGQGLAIARTAVNEHHRGQLTFETRLGEGTTFFIRLPIETPPSTSTSAEIDAGVAAS